MGLRGKLGALILALGGVVFALLVLELALRVFWHEPERTSPQLDPIPSSLRGLPALKGVLALARPHARGIFAGVLHRTNRDGVRGPEYSHEPPPGTFRIVVSGDSVTMGQGVEEDEAYSAVLESFLGDRGDGRRYEVINLGISGLSIRHIVARLEKVGLRYRPHLVVYGFTLNDIEGEHYEPADQETVARAQARMNRFEDSRSQLLRLAWPRAVRLVNSLHPLPGTYEAVLEQNYLHSPAAWRQIGDGLDRLSQIGARRWICVHLFVHSDLNWLRSFDPHARINRRVLEAARERGLTASESRSLLRRRAASRDPATLRVPDGHPNADAHRLYAEALMAGLEDLPRSCWEPPAFQPRG
jgi:lysophospholipase L1-like esterase